VGGFVPRRAVSSRSDTTALVLRPSVVKRKKAISASPTAIEMSTTKVCS
jgi:hypothetical protein